MKSTHQATRVCSFTALENAARLTTQLDSRSDLSWIESSWFSAIAQQSPDLIGAVSIEGDWLCLNPSGRSMLGLTDFLPFTEMLGAPEIWNATIVPQLWECGHWCGLLAMTHHGETIWFESQWFLIREPFTNQPLGFATISRKIDPPEQETRFLADAAHELKSPLAVMSTSIDLLNNDQLSIERKQKHFRRLRSKIQQMTETLDDILMLSRSEQAELDLSEIDPVQVCAELIEEAQMNTDRHELVFSTEGSQSSIVTDEGLLQRILANLLSNSIKYSPNGGEIRCRLSIEAHQFKLEVQDSGIGIPIAEQSRLFQSFYRASNATRIAGTGLGLAIVKQCVDRLNGQIAVKSAVQVGTCFTVIIPVSPFAN
ncbi:ATPase, histidine kinase-, DNA gyrase B-, and HSP90-like domain protein [Leptolyngbya sp. NIES-3755]|nr:ATPase, histidine kinase-, DNA gyrase B-, and HSP90-like domain protein [Leptolyngbya sp. NIES-3755]